MDRPMSWNDGPGMKAETQEQQVTWNTPDIAVGKVERQGLGDRQDRLVKVLAVLGEALDGLEVKLEPVLGPNPGSPEEKIPPREPDATSPLGAYLHQAALRVARLTRQANELIDRVDL